MAPVEGPQPLTGAVSNISIKRGLFHWGSSPMDKLDRPLIELISGQSKTILIKGKIGKINFSSTFYSKIRIIGFGNHFTTRNTQIESVLLEHIT